MARIKLCLMNSNKEVCDPVKDTLPTTWGHSGVSEGDVGGIHIMSICTLLSRWVIGDNHHVILHRRPCDVGVRRR